MCILFNVVVGDFSLHSLSSQNDPVNQDISIFLGVKNENVFNIAVCELGGFLPIRGMTFFPYMLPLLIGYYFILLLIVQ